MPTQLHPKAVGVVFDTNVLVAVEREKADVFSQAREMFGKGARLAVTRQVVREMQGLKGRGKSMERAVKVVTKAMEKERVRVIETGAGNADDSLVEAARQGFAVVTRDRALRKRIKGVGGWVIYLRKNRLLKAGQVQ